MKIDQLVFIRDLVIKEELMEYNANIILIKTRSAIKILDPDDHNEADLYKY